MADLASGAGSKTSLPVWAPILICVAAALAFLAALIFCLRQKNRKQLDHATKRYKPPLAPLESWTEPQRKPSGPYTPGWSDMPLQPWTATPASYSSPQPYQDPSHAYAAQPTPAYSGHPGYFAY